MKTYLFLYGNAKFQCNAKNLSEAKNKEAQFIISNHYWGLNYTAIYRIDGNQMLRMI